MQKCIETIKVMALRRIACINYNLCRPGVGPSSGCSVIVIFLYRFDPFAWVRIIELPKRLISIEAGRHFVHQRLCLALLLCLSSFHGLLCLSLPGVAGFARVAGADGVAISGPAKDNIIF
jgi:hypothetical protein